MCLVKRLNKKKRENLFVMKHKPMGNMEVQIKTATINVDVGKNKMLTSISSERTFEEEVKGAREREGKVRGGMEGRGRGREKREGIRKGGRRSG